MANLGEKLLPRQNQASRLHRAVLTPLRPSSGRREETDSKGSLKADFVKSTLTKISSLAYSDQAVGGLSFGSDLADCPSGTIYTIPFEVAKDRSKEILREIQDLRNEILTRLASLEAMIESSVEDSTLDSTPSDESLAPPLPGVPVAPAVSNTETRLPTPAEAVIPLPEPAESANLPAGVVRVVVKPLRDFSLARVVEDALASTDGVESATLRELRGDSATIDATVGEGVSIVSSLRRKLPVAFDVTESTSESVTIALAQPMGERSSGVATPPAL